MASIDFIKNVLYNVGKGEFYSTYRTMVFVTLASRTMYGDLKTVFSGQPVERAEIDGDRQVGPTPDASDPNHILYVVGAVGTVFTVVYSSWHVLCNRSVERSATKRNVPDHAV